MIEGPSPHAEPPNVEKIADRPHRLTSILATISLVVSCGALLMSWWSYRLSRANLIVTQHGIVVHSLNVDRIRDQNGGSLLTFSSLYQNPSGFSVNNVKAHASVQITNGKERSLLLPESVRAPEFSALLMAKQEKGFTLMVRPSTEELASADSGEVPIVIDGDVLYETQDGHYGYTWTQCYMLQKLLPCPAK